MVDVEERIFHVVQTSGNFRNVIGEMTENALYGHLATRLASEAKAAAVLTELEEKNQSESHFRDSLGTETRIEIRRVVNESWEKKFGNGTVAYSIDGIVGLGFNHNCNFKRGDTSRGFTTIQHTSQLTREEVEAKFASALLDHISG